MRAILVMVALAANGCCWERDTSCIQDVSDRCYDVPVTECLDSSVEPQLPRLRSCNATLRNGDCADNGYTVRCGGYSVRPGSSC